MQKQEEGKQEQQEEWKLGVQKKKMNKIKKKGENL